MTGSQPVLFVFAAGNNGGGDNDGADGSARHHSVAGHGQERHHGRRAGAVAQHHEHRDDDHAERHDQPARLWQPETDSSTQVAGYSSRGNVGIGTEGTYGRFKPDVVAPGTFVVSTRSSQWDTNAYYNPTNVQTTTYTDQMVATNALIYYNVHGAAECRRRDHHHHGQQVFAHPFPTNLPIYVPAVGLSRPDQPPDV